MFRIALCLASALAILLIFVPGSIGRWAFPAVLAAVTVMGIAVIRASCPPHAPFDIYVFQQDSCKAVLAGTNPYTLTFPDVIGPEWYAPGVVVDGRVQFGYPYMPFTLLATLPGYILFGDIRYSHLATLIGAAALLAYARPNRWNFAAAALLLLQPRAMSIIERGWCEPITLLLLTGTVFTAVRGTRYLTLLLGLLLVSKQYMLAASGIAPLLLRRWDSRGLRSLFGESLVVALVATLPLALLAPHGFWRSAVMWQFHQPYRWDSLSFGAWLGTSREVSPIPWWAAFVAMAVAIVIALWRRRRTPAGFAAAVAFVYFVFFALSKQAFANYYFLVIGAMCCALGLAETPDELHP
jgi:hypothetical protein